LSPGKAIRLIGNTATVHTYTNKNPAWTWTYWAAFGEHFGMVHWFALSDES